MAGTNTSTAGYSLADKLVRGSQKYSTNDDYQRTNNVSDFLPVMSPLADGSYKQVLLGYTLPGIVTLTTVLNIFVFCILIKPTMRSSVNVILAALAVSDSLTGLTALPYYIYFYSVTRSYGYVPYHWCYIQKLCSGILPTIFHTVSVWLTFTLAVQRYIYLCHSLKAKTLCTVKRMLKASIGIVITSFLIHSPRLFDSTFVPVTIYSNASDEKINTCVEILQDWADYSKEIYFPVYYWLRLVTIHLIPSVGLIILNVILIAVIRTSSNRRKHLILQNRSSEWKRVREANCSTLLLVVVVTVFIIVEVPMALFMLLSVIKSQYSYQIFELDNEQEELFSVVFNFMILFSYPANFFIYVCMSKQFRSHVIKQVSFRRYSRMDTEKTLQTTSSRDKSSSMELLKSIFTVTPIPPVRSNRKLSATFSNGSNKSSDSSTKAPSLVTVKMAEKQEIFEKSSSCASLQSRTECTCNCPMCLRECRKMKLTANVNTYTNEIMY